MATNSYLQAEPPRKEGPPLKEPDQIGVALHDSVVEGSVAADVLEARDALVAGEGALVEG
eukprot:scaffold238872_cov29-Prasinocladus_malaysianus.AAC.1